jgi:hypothetical protein
LFRGFGGGLFSRWGKGGGCDSCDTCGSYSSCNSCNSCNTCDTCDSGCGKGGLFRGFGGGWGGRWGKGGCDSCDTCSSCNTCDTCDSGCGCQSEGFLKRFWGRFRKSDCCDTGCGCDSGCSGGCGGGGCSGCGGGYGAPVYGTPPAVMPRAGEQIPPPGGKTDTPPMKLPNDGKDKDGKDKDGKDKTDKTGRLNNVNPQPVAAPALDLTPATNSKDF